MQMRKRVWHRKRDLMQLDKDMSHNSSIEVFSLVGWSVGHVERNKLRYIFDKVSVVGLRYTVHRRCRQFGMLVRVFHISMRQ